MTCPICLRLVKFHTESQAMQCYTLYLRRAYDDPTPSRAWTSVYA